MIKSHLFRSIENLMVLYPTQKTPSKLYQHFINRPQLFNEENLKLMKMGVITDKMILLGTHYERKLFFSKARTLMMNCLSQFDYQQQIKSDLEQTVQLIIAISNLQILHTTFIDQFCEAFIQKQATIKIQALVQLYYSLKKINYNNPQVFSFIHNYEFYSYLLDLIMNKNFIDLTLNNIQSFLFIQSASEQNDRQQIFRLINRYFQLEKEQSSNIFNPKNAFQIAQIVYNLYPEIPSQDLQMKEVDYQNFSIAKDNPFESYFKRLKEKFIISKILINRKYKLDESGGTTNQLTYIERKQQKQTRLDNHFSGMNLFIEQFNKSFQNESKFELNIDKVLNTAGVNFLRRKIYGIYEIDFLFENGIILELNGDTHFILNFDTKEKAKSFNYKLKIKQVNN